MPIEITDTFYLNGTATNPTAIVYTILGPDGNVTTYNWPGDPEITNPAAGEFVLALSPPALPGLYQYDVNSSGTVVASRAGSFYVLADASVPTEISWAVAGPCSPWVSSNDVWNCCGQPTTTIDGVVCAVDFAAEAVAASQILFEMSGRQFAGGCEQTVRPCATQWCGFQVLSRGHIVDYWYEMGYRWHGSWWGESNHCGCMPLSRVLLPGYPVREILEVKIDGDIVDPDTYRLDKRRWLTRTRDVDDPDTMLLWPACQMLDLPDTEDGTFSVTYRYGEDVPLAGTLAAAELACEISRACGGDADCNLPSSAVRVTRQGVTIDRLTFASWGMQDGQWKTGLTNVDLFLSAYNATGMQQRPRTWSPDGPKYAQKLGT